jgi:DNA-binding HxlR family transcriptional regulator
MADSSYQKGIRVCSVARALDIVGDRWTFLVLREAFFGTHYYDRFQTNTGISTNILSSRLKRLVENGIMEKRAEKGDSRRYRYRLTEKGLDLYPITLALLRWGDRWLVDENGPPLLLTHKRCGKRLVPVSCCKNCGEEITPHDVTYKEVWRNLKKEKVRGSG